MRNGRRRPRNWVTGTKRRPRRVRSHRKSAALWERNTHVKRRPNVRDSYAERPDPKAGPFAAAVHSPPRRHRMPASASRWITTRSRRRSGPLQCHDAGARSAPALTWHASSVSVLMSSGRAWPHKAGVEQGIEEIPDPCVQIRSGTPQSEGTTNIGWSIVQNADSPIATGAVHRDRYAPGVSADRGATPRDHAGLRGSTPSARQIPLGSRPMAPGDGLVESVLGDLTRLMA